MQFILDGLTLAQGQVNSFVACAVPKSCAIVKAYRVSNAENATFFLGLNRVPLSCGKRVRCSGPCYSDCLLFTRFIGGFSMNRAFFAGIAILIAVVGFSMIGTDSQAVAGHGCHGCSGCDCSSSCDCGGHRHRRHRRCHGCDCAAASCCAPAPTCAPACEPAPACGACEVAAPACPTCTVGAPVGAPEGTPVTAPMGEVAPPMPPAPMKTGKAVVVFRR